MKAVAIVGWLLAAVGLVMVVAAAISKVMKRLLRLSDETVNDPWFRRNDTSGMSWALHWMRPGLILLLGGGVMFLVAESL